MKKIKDIVTGIINTEFKKEEIEKLAKDRNDICNPCEFNSFNRKASTFDTTVERCTICNCVIQWKIRVINQSCPKGKW